jgi:hypothetical protein
VPRGRTFSVLYEIIESFSDLAMQYGTEKVLPLLTGSIKTYFV